MNLGLNATIWPPGTQGTQRRALECRETLEISETNKGTPPREESFSEGDPQLINEGEASRKTAAWRMEHQ